MVRVHDSISFEIFANVLYSLRVQVHMPRGDEAVGRQMGLRERPRDDQELFQDLRL